MQISMLGRNEIIEILKFLFVSSLFRIIVNFEQLIVGLRAQQLYEKNVAKSVTRRGAGSLGWHQLRDDVNVNPRTVRAVSSALIRISTSFPLVFQTMDHPP